MKYADEFRDPALARALVAEIARRAAACAASGRTPVRIMEVCGGHTHAIFRYGIEGMVPETVELVHGPGCPVCVLPAGIVDDCLAIAERPEVIFATFGDALRVPGSQKSLLDARAAGADVRMVYSPLDALALARANPDREIVFFAIGFDTTMPATALTILRAASEGIANFAVFCNHITIVPTLRAVLADPALALDGFVGPGHVAMVTGAQTFRFIAEDHNKPIVISGFEPLDILQSVAMVLRQLAEGRSEVENQYARVAAAAGNRAALAAIAEVYEPRARAAWRGLGAIDGSGIRLRPRYAAFDAERKFAVPGAVVADPAGCRCGAVLTGAEKPWQCPAFGTACTPERPLGALMVSSEGACAAYYRYGGARPRAAAGAE